PTAPLDDDVASSAEQVECEVELELLDPTAGAVVPEVDPRRHHPVIRTHPHRGHRPRQVGREVCLPATGEPGDDDEAPGIALVAPWAHGVHARMPTLVRPRDGPALRVP